MGKNYKKEAQQIKASYRQRRNQLIDAISFLEDGLVAINFTLENATEKELGSYINFDGKDVLAFPVHIITHNVSVTFPDWTTPLFVELIDSFISSVHPIDEFHSKQMPSIKAFIRDLKEGIEKDMDVVAPFADVLQFLQDADPKKTKIIYEGLLTIYQHCIARAKSSIQNYNQMKL